ncbi:MAG TPA: hypothetical protein VJ957_06055 [Longimicrobiales bacterium]|nr:hypothetical protein [Longimicrobiales bacterium]
MLRRSSVIVALVMLAGCASARSAPGPGLTARPHLSVSNPTQYPVRVYASRTLHGHGARLGELAIGGHASYVLPYAGDVFFRLERLNGLVVTARAHVAPGDRVELEPDAAWRTLFVTVRPHR